LSESRRTVLRYLRFAVVTRPKRAAARKASGARDVGKLYAVPMTRFMFTSETSKPLYIARACV